jgi:RNA polymerase sigma-70 factor (ECF subfamily)
LCLPLPAGKSHFATVVRPDCEETRRLLERVRAGEREAFEQLFAHHRPTLRRFVERRLDPRLRARIDPSDVVQEAQLEGYGRLPDYLHRDPMPFRLWLRKTAYEQLLKARRRHLEAARRSVAREAPLPDQSSLQLAERLVDSRPTPSQELSREEVVRRVREAVGQLPEADREILLLRTFEGRPYDELGCRLNLDPVAARKRYGRALLRLRKLLLAAGLLEDQP